mgnify:CR=1 FL=1
MGFCGAHRDHMPCLPEHDTLPHQIVWRPFFLSASLAVNFKSCAINHHHIHGDQAFALQMKQNLPPQMLLRAARMEGDENVDKSCANARRDLVDPAKISPYAGYIKMMG